MTSLIVQLSPTFEQTVFGQGSANAKLTEVSFVKSTERYESFTATCIIMKL